MSCGNPGYVSWKIGICLFRESVYVFFACGICLREKRICLAENLAHVFLKVGIYLVGKAVAFPAASGKSEGKACVNLCGKSGEIYGKKSGENLGKIWETDREKRVESGKSGGNVGENR